MIFTKRYRYRFGDIDHGGIAYYPSLLHYFHCCFEDWWTDGLGTPYPEVIGVERYGLPAVHIDADFYRQIRYGDEPAISLGVLRLGTSSVLFGYWMSIGEGETACRARITTVSVNMDTMEKQSIPDRWRTKFAEFQIAESEFPGKE